MGTVTVVAGGGAESSGVVVVVTGGLGDCAGCGTVDGGKPGSGGVTEEN